MTFTEIETQVLKQIINSDYWDGRPKNDPSGVWTSSIDGIVSGKSLSGTVSSLVKKGVIWSCKDGRDSTIGLSYVGFLLAKSVGLIGD